MCSQGQEPLEEIRRVISTLTTEKAGEEWCIILE